MKYLLVTIALGVLAMIAPGAASASACSSPTKAATVDTSTSPFMAVASADNCWLFVSLASPNHRGWVAVLRNQDGSFTWDHRVELKAAAHGEALTHDGQTLVVTTADGVAVLDVPSLEHNQGTPVLGTFTEDADSGSMYAAISGDDHLLFVSEERAHRIGVFDLAKARKQGFGTTALIGHIPMARAPVGLALSPDGHWLYATSESAPLTADTSGSCPPEMPGGRPHPPGLLFRIDVDKAASDPTHASMSGAFAGCNPVRVTVSPSGDTLWITARGDGALLKFQADEIRPGNDHLHVGKFPVGPSPVGIAMRPDGKQIWVAISARFSKKSDEGRLTELTNLDGAAPTIAQSTPATGFPREVSFLPDGRTLVATRFTANQVMIIPTSP